MVNFLKKWMSIGKKIFIVIAVYFVVTGLFLHFIRQDKPALAVDPIKKNREIIYQTINDPKLNSTQQGKMIVWAYRSITCGIVGEACTNNPADADKYYSKSVIGFMSNLVVLPYRYRPASGLYWAYSGLQNAGFVPKSYATEGIGFAALQPISSLWKVFRDLAYMILVLFLIAIGFMIMFRMKLNPQTVISIENALPKIVISLILITFSFAIAGFLIDLMYIIMALGIAVMSNRGNFFNITEFQNRYLNAGFDTVWFSLFPQKSSSTFFGGLGGLMALGESLMNMLPDVLNQVLRTATGTIMIFIMPRLFDPLNQLVDKIGTINVGVPIASMIPPMIDVVLKPILVVVLMLLSFFIGYNALPVIFFVLVSVTVIVMLFRLFFTLFAAYLKILLMIVFSPIFMLFEAVPGKSAFSYWFKNLFAEIITFPLVVILFIVAYIIVNTPSTTGNLWTPPFLADFNPNVFAILLGFGIMFQIPDFIKLVKEMLGVKDMPIGLNLGTFFGGAAGLGGGAMGAISSVGTLRLGLMGFGDAMGQKGGPIDKMMAGLGLKKGGGGG